MIWIFFDIDNTLYDQRSYLRQASHTIARALKKKRYYRDLMALWKKHGTRYPRLFNDFLEHAGIFSQTHLQTCIRIFHAPVSLQLKPYKDAALVLQKLKRAGVRLGIITDGNEKMQRLKLQQLGLAKFFKPRDVHYAAHYGMDKTDPRLFAHIAHSVPHGDTCWYVGDNPHTDFVESKKAGFVTVRMTRGEFRLLRNPSSVVTHTLPNLRRLPVLVMKQEV